MGELDRDPELNKLVKYLIHQSLPLAISTSGYNPTTRDLDMIEEALKARYGADLANVSIREIDEFLHRRFSRLSEKPNRRTIHRFLKILAGKAGKRS